jgi:hypothetical protein
VNNDPELRSILNRPLISHTPVTDPIAWQTAAEKKELLIAQLKQTALKAAEQRDFTTARSTADSIPHETFRKGTMAQVYKICFDFGDREAIGCALHLSTLMKENRDAYLCEFIDDCKKVKDKTIGKEFSIEATKQLSDHQLKTRKLFEIKKFYLGD